MGMDTRERMRDWGEVGSMGRVYQWGGAAGKFEEDGFTGCIISDIIGMFIGDAQ